MTMTQASAAYFEQVADEWDTLRAGYFRESVRDAAIARAYLRPEMVVADIGTGTGFVAAGLAPLVRQVVAVDGSAAMLEAARRNLSGFANVTIRLADGAKLPFEDGSLDAVFANMYLHHCTDPRAAVTEMVRVLRPGGRLVMTDMDHHDHEWMRNEMADEWLGFDRAQVKGWLRDAGLVNIVVDCTSQSCCATSQADAASQAEISVFVATGSRRVSGAREAVRANYGAVAESGPCGCSSATVTGPDAERSLCCSPSSAMELVGSVPQEVVLYDTGYTREQLDQVPVEAVNLSLGCGNPTAMASLRPGQVVLDIGSGAGIDAFYAARRVGPQGRVLGLDMTPAMIERARQSAAAAGLDNVEFRLGQAEAMPIEDGTVDVILSNCVINLAEDKGRVFEEAYRVLKDGGRLSISDMVTGGPLPMDLRSDAQMWAGCINGALPEQEYLDLVTQAGFSGVVAKRTLSGGDLAGVPVYSLSVSARKNPA
jgi:ubiquinone/menaquinone biosynthesis C-methylase UbiE